MRVVLSFLIIITLFSFKLNSNEYKIKEQTLSFKKYFDENQMGKIDLLKKLNNNDTNQNNKKDDKYETARKFATASGYMLGLGIAFTIASANSLIGIIIATSLSAIGWYTYWNHSWEDGELYYGFSKDNYEEFFWAGIYINIGFLSALFTMFLPMAITAFVLYSYFKSKAKNIYVFMENREYISISTLPHQNNLALGIKYTF